MKTYRIKEFAGNLGVTEKTLRHYEKYKIVEPSVDESNGYRSYNFRDAERILVSRRFSSMEFWLRSGCGSWRMNWGGLREAPTEGLSGKEMSGGLSGM